MTKDKLPKTKGVPNKHLHARTTFLYQAATYLTLQARSTPKAADVDIRSDYKPHLNKASLQGHSSLALQLASDLQNVSRKGQVRLTAGLKWSICKSCNTVLVPGRTATQRIENDSNGAKKPWADVLVIECTLCASKKRFPIGAKRQKRKTARKDMGLEGDAVLDGDDIDKTTNSTLPISFH